MSQIFSRIYWYENKSPYSTIVFPHWMSGFVLLVTLPTILKQQKLLLFNLLLNY